MKRLTGIAGLFAPLALMAQLESPVPIVLEGNSNADRQVKGSELPIASDHGASAEAVRVQAVQRATASGTNTLTASLTPSASGYSAGMLMSIMPGAANDTAVTLNVDGLGAVPVLKFTNEPLDSADLRPGIPVLLVFDGAAFQLISQTGIACPPGMLEVNRDVCVEASPSGPASWYNAVSTCNLRGYRLCGWADWFKGCSMPGGFINSIVEYEWLDNASNDNNHGKRVGLTTGTTIPNCYGGGTMIPNGSNNFRCCYNK
ncbi:MAG: hypothetical protein IPJ76_14350 [Flavobacteriales bacterium]|nr:MAG: hypothetical protein IPJ76_14350 [Flavobacteriales bacterium]